MVNKDFLKDVLAERKKLLKLTEVRQVAVPKYDELSVRNIFPLISKDPQVMQFMPDIYPKGREPDRCYMFNVLNTVKSELL
jgi:hypothetical protein